MKQEKKKNIIKRVRFHDDEPEDQSFDEESDESSYEIRVAKKRQVTRVEEVDIDQQEYKLRSKRIKSSSQDVSIEETVEIKKNVKPLKQFIEQESS